MKLLLSLVLCQVLSKNIFSFGFLTLGLTPWGSTSVSSPQARVLSKMPLLWLIEDFSYEGLFNPSFPHSLNHVRASTSTVSLRSSIINIYISLHFVKEYPK
jgi:hypothetical protein